MEIIELCIEFAIFVAENKFRRVITSKDGKVIEIWTDGTMELTDIELYNLFSGS